MATLLFILGIILFILLIVIHELGHAIAARRNKVDVEEFGIGFPPKAWGKKLKNGTLFTINWLPLGGFVRLKGESDDSKGKGSYGAASLWAKTKILLAGVVMNWVTAIVLFTILAWVGLPQILGNQFTVENDTTVVSQKAVVAEVQKDSPAAKLGLKQGDIITSIAGKSITSGLELTTTTKANAGKEVSIEYERAGKASEGKTTLRPADAKDGNLGISPGEQTLRRSTWSAPIVGVGVTAQFTWETLKGLGAALGNLVTGVVSQLSFSQDVREGGGKALETAGQGVAGPVGIVRYLLQTAENAGLIGITFIIAILSLTLALMNVLPIPALDGGRLFLTLLYRGLKKPLTKEKEEAINTTGFMVLLGLIVMITFLDISKIAGGQ